MFLATRRRGYLRLARRISSSSLFTSLGLEVIGTLLSILLTIFSAYVY